MSWIKCREPSQNRKSTEQVVQFYNQATNPQGEMENTGLYAELDESNRSRDYVNVGAYESIEKNGFNSERDYVNVNYVNGQKKSNVETEGVSGVYLEIL